MRKRFTSTSVLYYLWFNCGHMAICRLLLRAYINTQHAVESHNSIVALQVKNSLLSGTNIQLVAAVFNTFTGLVQYNLHSQNFQYYLHLHTAMSTRRLQIARGSGSCALTFAVQGRAVYRDGGDRWRPQTFAAGMKLR